MRLYLDSAVIIYHVQRVIPFAASVDLWVSAGGTVLVSSELARMECLVLPIRNGDAALVAEFDTFFDARLGRKVDISASVFRRAAEIRA